MTFLYRWHKLYSLCTCTLHTNSMSKYRILYKNIRYRYTQKTITSLLRQIVVKNTKLDDMSSILRILAWYFIQKLTLDDKSSKIEANIFYVYCVMLNYFTRKIKINEFFFSKLIQSKAINLRAKKINLKNLSKGIKYECEIWII